KSRLARDEASWTAKFYTWWHLIVKLDSKIQAYFGMVLKPFITFCFGPEGRDDLTEPIKLYNRHPSLCPALLKILFIILSKGIPSMEGSILPHEGLELPKVPIIKNSIDFDAIHVEASNAVFDFLIKEPKNELCGLAFEALASRIAALLVAKEAQGQEVLHEFFLLFTNTFETDNQNSMDISREELLISLVQRLLKTWDASLLQKNVSKLNQTPREILFDLVLKNISYVTIADASVTEKPDESYIKLIGKLMDYPESFVAGPQHVLDLQKLIASLESLVAKADESQFSTDISFIPKVLGLWDQVGKLVVKDLRSESVNEECNSLSKNCLMRMMLLPIQWLIKWDVHTNTSSVEKQLTSWKSLLQKYVTVSKLAVSLNKQHPFDEVCDKILALLQEKKSCQTSTVAALVYISSQFVALRNSGSPHCTQDDVSEVPLLALIATLLSQQVAPTDARIAKATKQLVKTLQLLMYTQTNLQFLLGIFKIFFTLLMIPTEHLNVKDEHLADTWKMFTHHFTDVTNKRSPGADTRETKLLLKELLSNLVQLKLHKNIKVQQGAQELEDAFNTCIHKTNQRFAAVKGEEQRSTSPRGFAPPSQSMLSFKRGRRSAVSNVSPPVTAPSSPTQRNKPVLEDQDSQDFVKIAPKPKSKKVLTPHQKESKRKRRDDIPALYQGLSQDPMDSSTQDTQDSPMDIAFPASTSISTIMISEDANDAVMSLPATESSYSDTPSKDTENQAMQEITNTNPRPILEPIQVGSKANKNIQEIDVDPDVIVLDNVPSNQTSKGSVNLNTSLSNKKNVAANRDVVVIETPAKIPSQSATVSEQPVDDEVMFISESPKKTTISSSPSKNKSLTENETLKEKENVQVTPQTILETQDTQDVEIVENSQNSAPVLESSSTEDEFTSTTIGATKITITRLRNRQGVTLQARSSKSTESKLKTSSWPARNLSSRGAQLLGLVNATKDTSSDSNTMSSSKQLPREVTESSEPTKSQVSTEVKADDEPTVQPTKDSISETSASTSTETSDPMEVEMQEKSYHGENSPDKSFSLEFTPTPTDSTPLSKRSNLKRSRAEVGGADDVATPSPSPKKFKRVSFSVPVVTSKLESPKILSEPATYNSLYRNNSPKSAKKKDHRVSRKLLLVAATNATVNEISSSLGSTSMTTMVSQGSVKVEVSEDQDSPVYPPLIDCKDPVELIASKLSSPMLTPALVESLKISNICTIGDLSALNEICVKTLEIKEPKIETLKIALSEPEDGEESSLGAQLKKLVEQHSLPEIMRTLCQQSKTEDMEVIRQSLFNTSDVAETAKEVSMFASAKGDRQQVLADIANNLTATETLEVLKLQKHATTQASTSQTEPMPVNELLTSLNQPKEVLNYVASHVDTKEVLQMLVMKDHKLSIKSQQQLLDYLLKQVDKQTLVKTVASTSSIADLAAALGKEEIVEYLLGSVTPMNLLSKTSFSLSMPDVLQAIGRENEVIDTLLITAEPVVVMKKAALLLKDGELTKIITTLEPAQQDEVSSALPNPQISQEFTRRCTNGKMPVDQVEKVFGQLPSSVVSAALQCLPDVLSNLLRALVEKSNSPSHSFEALKEKEKSLLNTMFDSLPPAFIIQEVQNRLDSSDEFKQLLLAVVSNMALLDNLISKIEKDEELREVATDRILEAVPVHKILGRVEKMLQPSNASKQTLKVLQNMLTKYLPKIKIAPMTLLENQPVSDTEKFEMLEYLVSMTAIKDVMAILPIKDVIQYYEQLVVMPECRAPLLRTSLENVDTDDMLRFIGTSKFLKVLKDELNRQKPSITLTQIAKVLPTEFTEAIFVKHLSRLPTTPASVELLKNNFKKDLLMMLLSEFILHKCTTENEANN
ncbi:hypothetical protein B566_EDAN004720, partial [Ephemera danica]